MGSLITGAVGVAGMFFTWIGTRKQIKVSTAASKRNERKELFLRYLSVTSQLRGNLLSLRGYVRTANETAQPIPSYARHSIRESLDHIHGIRGMLDEFTLLTPAPVAHEVHAEVRLMLAIHWSLVEQMIVRSEGFEELDPMRRRVIAEMRNDLGALAPEPKEEPFVLSILEDRATLPFTDGPRKSIREHLEPER